MAHTWLTEIYEAENFEELTLEQWATPERLNIPEFDLTQLARFYPQLYRRRYGDHEQSGYAFLESQMEGKEPSYGYSVLAYLLSETPHRVVITTNFDNLVADALSIHSSRFPIVIGHDTLAQYAAVELRRPLVAKIHGALGFSPKSQPDDIASLPDGWRPALQRIFERYTPVVIGYEGNDGSLMGFLQSLPDDVPDRVLWCVYAPGANPGDCLKRVSPEVRDFVRARRGRFVPIWGFDELMAKLLSRLREHGSVPDLYERLKERARQREESYDDQQRRLFEASAPERQPDKGNTTSVITPKDLTLTEAVSGIAESRKDKPWWVWDEAARNAPDDDSKERAWLQALDAYPDSVNLLRSYALFLEQRRRDYDKAEEYYRRGLKVDPNNSRILAFYADFLYRYRKDVEQAEEHFIRSLEADPEYGYALNIYAELLEERGDLDKAEEHYQRAAEAKPARYLEDYVRFLRDVRQNEEKATALEKRALSIQDAIS